MAARSADTLHTSAWDAVPEKKVASKPGEKKPKIEMAVDTIKEKKKKTVDMIQKVIKNSVSVHGIYLCLGIRHYLLHSEFMLLFMEFVLITYIERAPKRRH